MPTQEQKITLDQYQKQVVSSKAKDVLVLAGAGSGKTLTLLTKIHNLVTYQDVNPECVLVLTFTRVASESMRDKYLQMQDSKYDAVPDFCTFHAFCYQVMRKYPEVLHKLGYETLPDVADDTDMAKYVLRARDVSACKLTNRQLEHPEKLSGKQLRQYENYSVALKRILKQANVIDYDSLSEKVCNLFVERDDSVLPVVSQYKYVFVDEFQDTDPWQYLFVMSLDKTRRVLCGDALQNIYQFRGCSNEPMKQLMDDESWQKYVLPVNYRSSYQICDYVNRLSSRFVSAKYRVRLKSDVAGPRVRAWNESLGSDKYGDVASYVSWAKKQGTVAVLCRTNAEVAECVEQLKVRNVSCSRQLDKEYSSNLLKCLADKEFLFSWIVSNLTDKEYERYCRERTSGLSDSDVFLSSRRTQYPTCVTIVEDYLSVTSVLESSLQEATFVLCHMLDVDEPKSDVESVDELVAYLTNRCKSKQMSHVYVGTIHSVKGLEFNSVAVLGVNSKAFRINNEERENLLYTACTRAEKNLIVFEED